MTKEIKRYVLLLTGIFLAALLIRFLYFPENVYFGFDQARDAFATKEILGGHLKIVGPPTSLPGLFHGPLYYYLYAPFYFLGGGDPGVVQAFIRVVNALGVFLVFIIAAVIFNSEVGIIAAILYAFSFSQTQFAIYFNHPSFAVISVMIFYLGLALLIFKKNKWGLSISLVGLGLSIQFEFVLTYLIAYFFFITFIFRKRLPKFSKLLLVKNVAIFLVIISSFIIEEIKFRNLNLHELLNQNNQDSTYNLADKIRGVLVSFITDNLFSVEKLAIPIFFFLIIAGVFYASRKKVKSEILFLSLWLSGGVLVYLFDKSTTPSYFYSVGATVSILIFAAFLLKELSKRSAISFALIVAIIISSNILLITTQNPKGPLPNINVQIGMLLPDELEAIDYMYKKADGQPFAIDSLSMPFSINTTWSYLFEWYGQNKYHYLPVWGNKAADGYPGNIKVISSKSTLPIKRFLIIEPLRGIPNWLSAEKFQDEGYFTRVIEEVAFNKILVQFREPLDEEN